MSKKRAIIVSVPVLVVIGWAASVFLSIRQVGDQLPKLRQLDSIAAEAGSFTPQQAPPRRAMVSLPSFANPVPVRGVAEETQIEMPEDQFAALSVREDEGVLEPPLSIEERCVLMRDVNYWLVYGPGRIGSRVVAFYDSMPVSELKAKADIEDDGFAQYFYAQRQLQTYIAGHVRGNRNDTLADTIRKYFAKAIRHQIKGWGPYYLAWLSYAEGDRPGAAAWLTVDDRMGGDGFEEFRLNALRVPDGSFILDQYDVSEGANRAEELIAEYDLEAGLLPPEECGR